MGADNEDGEGAAETAEEISERGAETAEALEGEVADELRRTSAVDKGKSVVFLFVDEHLLTG